MKNTNYDLVVTGVFHDRRPLSKRAVETLKYKKLGARRLVFALMDIGSAAAYRYYWQDDWREGSPEFIAAPFPNDPDRYFRTTGTRMATNHVRQYGFLPLRRHRARF